MQSSLTISFLYQRDGATCVFFFRVTDTVFIKNPSCSFLKNPLITTGGPIAGHDCALNPTALVAYGNKIFAVDELYETTGNTVEIELSDRENNDSNVG